MASLHKQKNKPNWFCAFTTSDGTRHFKSTGTTDKKQAEQVCRAWAKASLHGERLNADKAREIIASGVADVMAASGDTLPSATIREWCTRWLEVKEIENERTTHTRYEQAIRVWLEYLGSSADKNLETLTADSLLKFRDDCANKVSVGSTNTNLRIIRACLNSARQQSLIGSNPATLVKSLKERAESKRREMKLAEIQNVLKVCGKTDWRGMVWPR
ncbi:MAG TPA: phage integrase SAM-like domain-containing protein [Verrucomicrobiae bacterium]|nr:phage integrase SAM-like domain-containing protein [Verrucomicrobiae bacterium]